MTEGILEATTKIADSSVRVTVIGTGAHAGKFRALMIYYTNASAKMIPGDVLRWCHDKVYWTPQNNVEHKGSQYVDYDVAVSMKAIPWDPATRFNDADTSDIDNLMGDWD